MTTIRVSPGAKSDLKNQEWLLKAIVWLLMILITAAGTILTVILPQYWSRWLVLALTVDIVGVSALLLVRARHGYKLASWLLLSCLWLLFTALAITGGGMRAPVVAAFLPLALTAGLLLGFRAGIIAAIICVVTELGLAFAEYWNVLPTSLVEHNGFTLWIGNLIPLALAVILQYLSVKTVRDNLARAESDLEERKLLLRSNEERVKELSLLHDVARFFQTDRPLNGDFLKELAALIPAAWRYPEVCAARIEYGGLEGASHNWRDGQWKQAQDFVCGTQQGRIEVVYLEKRWIEADGPFLMEERTVLESFAEMLAVYVNRQETALALRQSEELFRAMFERAGIGMTLADMNGQLMRSNAAMQLFIGYDADELNHTTLAHITQPDDFKADQQLVKAAAEGPGRFQTERRYIRKDGSIVWGRITVSLIRDVNGQPLFRIGMVEDITQRKAAEERVQKSEARFRALTENSLAGIYITQDGRMADVNPAMAKIFGYEPDEVIGRDPLEFVHPDDREMVAENIRRRLAGELEYIQYEFRGLKKGGETVYIEALSKAIELGGRRAIIGNALDVTERKRAQAALRESEERYRSIISVSNTGAWEYRADTGYVWGSPEYFSIAGRKIACRGCTASRVQHRDRRAVSAVLGAGDS
jgi:PAS domain S-box-containing protein